MQAEQFGETLLGSTLRALNIIGALGGYKNSFLLPGFRSSFSLERQGYGSIPIDTFLVGWTSIYQLFWGSPGVQGFDTLPQQFGCLNNNWVTGDLLHNQIYCFCNAPCQILHVVRLCKSVSWHRVLQKKQPSCHRNLHAPFPPIQCCYVALLGKAFKKKQPFRFGCRHALGNNIDQGGAGGSGDVTTCRRMAGFFEEPGEYFFGLWMGKHKLEQTPFCTCQNLNPNTLSSSKLLPTKQRSNRYVFWFMGVQTKTQCTATKRCKYHVFSQK